MGDEIGNEPQGGGTSTEQPGLQGDKSERPKGLEQNAIASLADLYDYFPSYTDHQSATVSFYKPEPAFNLVRMEEQASEIQLTAGLQLNFANRIY